MAGLYGRLGKFACGTGGDPTAQNLLSMLGHCPACALDFTSHHYTLFAVTVAGKKNVPRLADSIQHAKAHDWKALRAFQEFDGLSDSLEAFVVRCSSGGSLVLARSPFELYESDEVLMIETLAGDSFAELAVLVAAKEWRPFILAPAGS